MLAKELDCALPGISRSFRFIHFRSRVVEERVIRARVDLHFDLFAEIFYLTFHVVNRSGRHRTALFSKDTEYWRVQVRQIGFGLRMYSVEHDASADVLILGRCVQGQSATHAKSYDTDLLARRRIRRQQVLNSTAEIFFGLVDVEGHHELPCFIGRLRRLAVIHVWRESNESLICKPIANVLDVIHKSPPLLNHNHAGPAALFWCREISAGVSAVKRELNYFTHCSAPTLFPIFFDPATHHPNDSSRRDEYQTDRSRAS